MRSDLLSLWHAVMENWTREHGPVRQATGSGWPVHDPDRKRRDLLLPEAAPGSSQSLEYENRGHPQLVWAVRFQQVFDFNFERLKQGLPRMAAQDFPADINGSCEVP